MYLANAELPVETKLGDIWIGSKKEVDLVHQ